MTSNVEALQRNLNCKNHTKRNGKLWQRKGTGDEYN